MKKRCNNPRDTHYTLYGGRGIAVCDEWQEFMPFYEWAMNNGYQKGLVIDRTDNNQGYSPNNCRFVTVKENNCNKRNNRIFEFNGEHKTLSQWTQELGLPYKIILQRINKLNWPIDRALITPIKPRKKGGEIFVKAYA